LDELGIERVPVISVSAGGIPSMYFALRYPERTEALVLVSAVSYTEETSEDYAKEDGIKRLVSSDFVYWAAVRSTPASMLKLFGVTEEVQAKMSPTDKEYANEVLDVMLPMSLRWEGILLDQSRQIGKDLPLTQIQIPTLVIHAQDDTLVTLSHGEYSARQIPGAELITLEDGGHFLLGHNEEVYKSVTGFLAKSTIAADY
jgi:2-hydroxy-6-oxonona-2,4-dienedioate hydrolase